MSELVDGITTEYLISRLDYSPESGILIWKPVSVGTRHTKSWNTRYAGKRAGNLNTIGYRTVRLFDNNWLEHRVIWQLVYGRAPEHEIDHVNGDPSDNRIANLRAATRAENMRNAKRPNTNTSGVVGVRRTNGGWMATIYVENQQIYLGYSKNIGIAAKLRADAEILYGYHPNHGRQNTTERLT